MKRGKLNKKLKKKTIFNKKTILVVVIVVVLVAALIFYSLRPKRTPTKEELLKMFEERSETSTLPTPYYVIIPVTPCWCNGADIDHDGDVDMEDFKILADNWLREDCGGINKKVKWCNNADINCDGKVNLEDYSILANNFRRTDCSASSADYIGCSSSDYICA